MAILKNPDPRATKGGSVDKLVVVRHFKDGRVVLSSFPDMSNVKPSTAQIEQRRRLAEAQKYVKELLSDPATKEYYKSLCQGGQRPHNIATADWLKQNYPAKVAEKRSGTVVVDGNPRYKSKNPDS